MDLSCKDVEDFTYVQQDGDDVIFPTAVSEEQLKEARKKSQRLVIGSNSICNLLEDNGDEGHLQGKLILGQRASEHYHKGLEANSHGDWEKSVICFTKAINLHPHKAQLYICRAEAYLQLCDFQSATLNYRKACELDTCTEFFQSRFAFIFYFQGQCLFDQGMYVDALESFAKALELRPDNYIYHIRSLACLACLGKHGECLTLVNKMLEKETGKPELYILRARLHKHLNHVTLCYHDVKTALTVFPNSLEAQSLLKELNESAEKAFDEAKSRLVMGKLHEALQKINTALENNPENVQYFLFRGILYRQLKDFSAAIDSLVLALEETNDLKENSIQIEAEKQLIVTYNDFAVFCFTRGFYDEAVMLLNKAIKEEKNEKGLYLNRGDCYFKMGELVFALEDYRQAEEIDSSDQTIHVRIAVVHKTLGLEHYKQGKYTQAVENLSSAIEYSPTMSDYYQNRANAKYRLSDMDGAKDDAIISLILDSRNKQVQPLISQLFPGWSLEEVLCSKESVIAKEKLRTSLNVKKDQSSSSRNIKEANILQKEPDCNSTLGKGIVACIEEKDLYKEIVNSKIKINQAVKAALHDRIPLHKEGSKIAAVVETLPEPSEATLSNKPYHWRKFGLGVGLLR
ncbi:tetratricopeptide repeat protein 16 [Erpetoichthys calabaricus]|uniref:tetratricopeptide repeat protein 16 n=1 Tax=Erpetoichthys calabaricus TaxID=27687 RepID=UPI002233F7A2|nr:tetratricopeptide repeat protein 16 [Erpetoichthys calabaricus]